MRPQTSLLSVSFIVSLLFASACSPATADNPTPAAEGALHVAGSALECAPVDSDEACGESADVGEYCISKIKVTPSDRSAELTVERKSPDDTSLSAVHLAESTSFTMTSKKVNGSWSAGDTWLSASRQDAAASFVGQIAMADGLVTSVECKVAGAPDLPAYLKTVQPYDECNGKNAQGQKLRCVAGAICSDENGDEIAVLSSKKGVCQPSLLHTAKLGEACNVHPASSVAVVLCERNAGLSCRDANGHAIAIAERNAPPGTCQQ